MASDSPTLLDEACKRCCGSGRVYVGDTVSGYIDDCPDCQCPACYDTDIHMSTGEVLGGVCRVCDGTGHHGEVRPTGGPQ